MKLLFHPRLLRFVLVLGSSFILHPSSFAQGSLTPPGPPAPTFKTLEQVEPRTPISTNTTPGDATYQFIISQPGSYYLTTNVVGVSGKTGIKVQASGVTLDLHGFALLGVPGSQGGIYIESGTNVCVRNGTISGWEESSGVDGSGANNCQFERLRISRNVTSGGNDGLVTGPGSLVLGCTALANGDVGQGGDGINAGVRNVVKDCAASENAGDGINAGAGSTVADCAVAGNHGKGIFVGDQGTVQNCSASANLSYGIDANSLATVKNCTVAGNQGAAGIRVVGTGVVGDCLVVSSSGHGIETGPGSTVQGCSVRGNTGDGIHVSANCSVFHNTATGNGDGVAVQTAGIHATGNGNRIDGNHTFANNGDGILVDTTAVKNFVVRNTSGGQTCGGCFQFRVPGIAGQPPAGANVVGPIVNDATNVNANAWANISP